MGTIVSFRVFLRKIDIISRNYVSMKTFMLGLLLKKFAMLQIPFNLALLFGANILNFHSCPKSELIISDCMYIGIHKRKNHEKIGIISDWLIFRLVRWRQGNLQKSGFPCLRQNLKNLILVQWEWKPDFRRDIILK